MTKEIENLYYAHVAADDAFHAAVVRQFGKKRAGDMRYQPKLFNSATAQACEAYHQAAHAFLEAKRAQMTR